MSKIEYDFGISDTSVLNWSFDLAEKIPTCFELNRIIGLDKKNKWSGILLLDGKHIHTHEGKYVELFASDFKTGDVIVKLPAPSENIDDYERLVMLVKRSGYTIRALVSDGEPSIQRLTQPADDNRRLTRTFPRPSIDGSIKPLRSKRPVLKGVPHQLCCVHFLREVDNILQYRRTRESSNKHLRYLVHRLLKSRDINSFNHRLKKIDRFDAETYEHKRVISKVFKNKKLLSTHLREKSYLDKSKRIYIPRSTNSLERLISEFEDRLKTMRRFKTKETAQKTMNLIVVNFRFKRMRNTRNRRKRGKSPIELGTGKTIQVSMYDYMRKSVA